MHKEKDSKPLPGIVKGMQPQVISSDPNKELDTRMMKDKELTCPKCKRKLDEHRRDGKPGYELRCVGTYLGACDWTKFYGGKGTKNEAL